MTKWNPEQTEIASKTKKCPHCGEEVWISVFISEICSNCLYNSHSVGIEKGKVWCTHTESFKNLDFNCSAWELDKSNSEIQVDLE